MSERNRPASAQRRQEALDRGQGPATPEVAGLLVVLAAAALMRDLTSTLPAAFARLGERYWSEGSFRSLARGTLELTRLASPDGMPPGLLVLIALPVAIALALLAQKGFRFMPGRLAPDVSRLMPKAPVSECSEAVEAPARALARLLLAGYLGYRLLTPPFPLVRPGELDLGAYAARLAAELAGLWVVVCAGDWLWRRYRFEQSILMTSEEVRQEARTSEGDPRVRAAIRARMESAMSHGRGPSRRVLLREGDMAALVAVYADAGTAPTLIIAARGAAAEGLVASAAKMKVLMAATPGAQRLSTVRPGAPVPPELYEELAAMHARLFRREGDRA